MRHGGWLLAALIAAGPAGAASLEIGTLHGGSDHDGIRGLLVTADGGVLTVGTTRSTDLPVPNGQQGTKGPGADGFLMKVSAQRTRSYGRYINGNGDETLTAVANDAVGRIYVAGRQTLNGAEQCVLMRFSASGDFDYARVFGGSGYEQCDGLAVEPSGRAHVVGLTESTDLPTTANAVQRSYGGGQDGLYAIFEPDGTLSYLSYFGGANAQQLRAVAVANGFAWITGVTMASGEEQGLLARLDADAVFGEPGEFGITLGGNGIDRLEAIVLHPSGSAYVAGWTTSSNLPVSPGVFGAALGGVQSCFFARVGPDGGVQRVSYGEADTYCTALALSPQGLWLGGNRFPNAYLLRTDEQFSSIQVRAALESQAPDANSVVRAIGVLPNGHAVVAGDAAGTFPATPNAFGGDPALSDGFYAEVSPAPPALRVDDCAVDEGAPGQTRPCGFRIALDRWPVAPVRFRASSFPDADLDATENVDYTAISVQRELHSGLSAVTVDVTVRGDALDENDERFGFFLSQLTGPAQVADAHARGTIVDDDAPPAVSVADATLFESIGTGSVAFQLAAVSGRAIEVAYTTVDGSATAPADYAARSGTVTIPAGHGGASLSLPIVGDALDEGDEDFFVRITGITHATLGDGEGRIVVLDDDEPPSLSIDGGCTVTESTGADVPCVFTVRLSAPSSHAVHFETSAVPGVNFDAAGAADFAGHDWTARSIPPGATTLAVTIPVRGDALDEHDQERFVFRIRAGANAAPGESSVEGVIVDDDAMPTLTVDGGGCSVTEGHAGTVPCTFVFRLSAPSERMVIFYSQPVHQGTGPDDIDFPFGAAPRQDIPPGQTTLSLSYDVRGDTLDELDEQFRLNLLSLQFATGPTHVFGTIVDDDAPPTVAFDTAGCAILEGGPGEAGSCTVVARLSAASGRHVDYTWRTVAGTATPNVDYAEEPPRTLSFFPGTLTQSFELRALADAVDEPAETFRLRLEAIAGATPAVLEAEITINDDDEPPLLVSIADHEHPEGSGGGASTASMRVSLSRPAPAPLSVDYETVPVTATPAIDYLTSAGVLQIPAGATEVTLPILIVRDALYETNERLLVRLSNPQGSGLALADAEAMLQIEDDDPRPRLNVTGCDVVEGASGARDCVLGLGLSTVAGRDVTVTLRAEIAADLSLHEGDFESPAIAGTHQTLLAGARFGSQWHVHAGSVDVVRSLWPALSGMQSIDLNGHGPGTLRAQTNTTAGQRYRFAAWVAANGGCGPMQKQAEVYLGAERMGLLTAASGPQVVFVPVELPWSVQAPVFDTPLLIGSLTDSACGLVIDRVTLAPEGVAIPGPDVSPGSVTVTIPAGQTQAQATLMVLGDSRHEGDERFTVAYASGEVLAGTFTPSWIRDDDPDPTQIFRDGFE